MKNKVLCTLVCWLVIFLLNSCCPENEKDVVYVNDTANNAVTPVPNLEIYNAVNQENKNVVVGRQGVLLAQAALATWNSEENIIVTAIIIEDVFSSNGNFTEFANLEIWADFTDEKSPRGDFAETLISDKFQPTAEVSPAYITIPLEHPVIIPQGEQVIFALTGDLIATADYVTPGQHKISIDSVQAYGSQSLTACTENEGTLVWQNEGITITNVDRATGSMNISQWNPDSKIITPDDTHITLVFDIEIDAAEDVRLIYSSISVNGNAANSSQVIESDEGWTGVMHNLPATSGFTIWYDSQPIINRGSKVTLTLKSRLYIAFMGTPPSVNGDLFQVSSVQIMAIGVDSGQQITFTGNIVGNSIYRYEAYPVVENKWLPTQETLTPDWNTQIAAFNITAIGSEDISFSSANGNNLTVNINSSCASSGGSSGVYLRDESNTLLSVVGPVDLCSGAVINFNFMMAPLHILAGTSKTIYVYADTVDFVNSGDYIEASLTEDDPNNIGWAINNTGNYHHADIIFAGDITDSMFIVQ